ncbi:MAG: polysaccharide biosynthesis tyrosine autokinase [Elusimicrobiota bacterium]
MLNNFSDQNEPAHLRNYLQVIYRRFWTIAIFFVVLVTTVMIGTFLQKPIYRATTQIMIEKENRNVNFQEVIGIEATGQDYYQTQYALLKSKSLAEKLVQRLQLDTNPLFKEKNNSSANENTQPELVDQLLNSIFVQPVRNTRLVNLSVESPSPQLAKDLTNTLAQLYLEQNLESRLFGSQEILKRIQEKGINSLDEEENRELVESLPSVVNNNLIQRLKADYAALETRQAEYKKRYMPKHPKMIQLQAEIGAMRSRIDQEIKRIVSSVKTELSGALQANNIRIIDFARTPRFPVRPNKKLNIIMAVFMGLILGGGLAFFLEYLDNTVKTPEDIENKLGLPFLGLVPRYAEKNAQEEKNKDLISFYQPRSTISEAFRTVRTKIMLSLTEQELKTILITSAAPKEGKTVNAINLGITFAQAGERTLLIDADMRNPRLSRVFQKGKNSPGLSNLLASPRLITNSDLEKTVNSMEVENLFVLSCGPIPPNPTELLNSKKMLHLLKLMEESFDRVIFDSPPLNVVADSIILANLVNGIALVVQANRTKMEMIAMAKQKMAGVKAKFIGTILNNVLKSQEYYYYGENRDSQKRIKSLDRQDEKEQEKNKLEV